MPGQAHMVYIGLGSNLEPRAERIGRALELLGGRKLVSEMVVSPFYQTAPMYVTNQPDFLNAVAGGVTTLDPDTLLAGLKRIEQDLGRHPTVRWGEREIDLDLLLFDDMVREGSDLTLPHPRMGERLFVLRPLGDIAPDLVLPKHKVSVKVLVESLQVFDPSQRVERYTP